MSTTTEREFAELDAQNSWKRLCLEIRESRDSAPRVARFPENRNRNRYRNVILYDHSRVKLQNTDSDYVNASLVDMEEEHSSYIIMQDPLPNTCCHFWLMVWQQKTKAVVMLNRVVEKELIKCAQYWPTKDEGTMLFEDTGFSVKLLSENVASHHAVYLQLVNINSGETRTISHFHYTTWPYFGVPQSPAPFFNFLFKVRESGSLSPEHRPMLVHCSAGIGQSGTFSLIDTCLILMGNRNDINIKQVLLNMRKYQMRLIQTPHQLRFSYMGIIEGAKFIKGNSNSPTRIMTEKDNGNRIRLEEGKLPEIQYTVEKTVEEKHESVRQKRTSEDRKANTAKKVQQMKKKQKLNDTARKRKRWLYGQPAVTKI
uniref:Tyrosine-protein phosphatase non-receptor type n=1 Tax=Loxodonta africana TaxID=9785 RepID=G3ULQ3_LOXAF